MKATGIVRRIDDLGRVVIPKEIRRTMRIREGDPLEIFTDREGEIILKKYSPMGELSTFAKEFTDSIALVVGCTVCIADPDQIIAVSGNGRKELQEQRISKQMEQVMAERTQIRVTAGEKNQIPITEGIEETPYENQIVIPIICAGDAIGAVILLDRDNHRKFNDMEWNVALCAATFLGKQMEQ